MKKGPKKRIWILSDGIPGHFNQSLGVATVLESQYDCDISWVEVRLRLGLLRTFLRVLLNLTRRSMSLTFFKCFYHCSELPKDPPDLLVGAGGKVSFALAWLGRLSGAPAVFSGSLRGLSSSNFALILSIDPQHAGPNVLVLDVAPMPVDRVAQREAGLRLRKELGLEEEQLWLLLVGGNGAGYRFCERDWRRLAQEVTELSKTKGIRWLISTSRRTGKEAERVLRGALCDADVIDAVWWSSEPRKVLRSYFGAANIVCCTEDSLSMLTEAVISGLPVLTWSPRHAKPEINYFAALKRLEDYKLLLRSDALVEGAGRLAGIRFGAVDQSTLVDRLILLFESSGRQ